MLRVRGGLPPRAPSVGTGPAVSSSADWAEQHERACIRRTGEHVGMPRISEFYGVVIAMYYREHGVAHFHATYAGETVVISIETGEVLAGTVSPRALRVVQEWAGLHREELRVNRDRAREEGPLERIDPLP